jgi:D-glycero-alpha-D-manno-heptose-7-phosphate kinase
MYITACKTSLSGIKAVYNDIEVVENINELKHDRIRNILLAHNISKNIEIASFSEIPTKGTGLGSSSSFTVGLLNAIYKYKKYKSFNKFDLAEDACSIEIDACGEPIGKQDQYAAAFGGLNQYTFYSDHSVKVTPVHTSSNTVGKLNNNLLLFFTGISRNASSILQEQSRNNNHDNLLLLADMAKTAYKKIVKDKLDDFGDMLDIAWKLKKSLASSISNNVIDGYYEELKKAGAMGGKLLGAGGGGYFLVYVPGDVYKSKVIDKAKKLGLKYFDFKFEYEGSRVIYENR